MIYLKKKKSLVYKDILVYLLKNCAVQINKNSNVLLELFSENIHIVLYAYYKNNAKINYNIISSYNYSTLINNISVGKMINVFKNMDYLGDEQIIIYSFLFKNCYDFSDIIKYYSLVNNLKYSNAVNDISIIFGYIITFYVFYNKNGNYLNEFFKFIIEDLNDKFINKKMKQTFKYSKYYIGMILKNSKYFLSNEAYSKVVIDFITSDIFYYNIINYTFFKGIYNKKTNKNKLHMAIINKIIDLNIANTYEFNNI